MSLKVITLVATIFATLEVARGYGSGAPAEACGDMVPQHKVDPQTTPFPYRITVNKKGIRPGEKVQITISSTKNAKEFKGFFVQGRAGETPIGKFEPAPGVKLVDCGGGKATGATHAKADSKEKIVLTWVAPPGLSETVRFRATVAKDGGTFWVGQLSSPVYVKA